MSQVSDPLKTSGNEYKLIFENDRARLMRATFKPGDRAPMHNHPDHIAYMLSGGKIKMTDSTGKTNVMELKTGEADFLPAQSHEAQNIGDTTVDMLVIEFKK
ncbi:MAG: cupin domain-containing protein [Candidatus Bathyarchaeia archaeon]|jgi:quercetin dioxygenase-like cupin family protein